MSLLDTIFKASIARRVGIWAIVQTLPDEKTLGEYLQRAYMGMASVIVGAVLTGAALTVGIVSLYHLMLAQGIGNGMAVLITATLTLGVIITCFILAARWFTELAGIKDEMAVFPRQHHSAGGLGRLARDAVDAVTDGFIEGLTNKPPSYTSRSHIRLIR